MSEYEHWSVEGLDMMPMSEVKKIISEFLEDLEIIENIDWDKYWSKFTKIEVKWREKLK